MPEDQERPDPEPALETTLLSGSRPGEAFDDSARHGRFIPGTLFGKRYRITGRLGRGGMGEVYGADDLELGQAVALKFLPSRLTKDPAALGALRNEVRVARQIAHPNVCRVYDLHEIDGQSFVVMEFVDGEDLAGLLRRIGRLPGEKAVDIIRQFAAGLSAAHDMGVLHRDIKPANVMIDGRGRVHIMDFGLAGFAEELRGTHVAAGTLGYMAPEQLAGKGPTLRSDVYSLGLVMYEILTGRRPYEVGSLDELRERQAAAPPSGPSALIKDCDPLVERLVMRCLSFDAEERPASALAVAAALPGGDPLAAAVAAGETPSPEMVAAAGGRGLLKPVARIALLGIVLLAFVAIALLNNKAALFRLARLENPPVVLAAKSREILEQLGFPNRPDGVTYGMDTSNLMGIIESTDQSKERWKDLHLRRPTPFKFWYREASAPMLPLDRIAGRVVWNDPPLAREGMCQIWLDQSGRLLDFARVAPFRLVPPDSVIAVDWSPFFALAELDLTSFEEAAPIWNPHTAADQRWAWEGFYPGSDSLPLRIEAGAAGGQAAYFALIDDGGRNWLLAHGSEAKPGPSGQSGILTSLRAILAPAILVAWIFIPALLAWRNLRVGRADPKSAIRFSIFTFSLVLLFQVLKRTHSSNVAEELVIVVIPALIIAVSVGMVLALGYLAMEPYLRRHWPDMLISWTRLTHGKYRDPLVGQDVLFGAAAGGVSVVLYRACWFIPAWVGAPTSEPMHVYSEGLLGGSVAIGSFFDPWFLTQAMIGTIVVTLLLVLFRRKLPAVIVSYVLLCITLTDADLGRLSDPAQLAFFAADALTLGLALLVAIRVGLLALVSFTFFYHRLISSPVTIDASAWYAGGSALLLIALAAIALYAFRVAGAGRAVRRQVT